MKYNIDRFCNMFALTPHSFYYNQSKNSEVIENRNFRILLLKDKFGFVGCKAILYKRKGKRWVYSVEFEYHSKKLVFKTYLEPFRATKLNKEYFDLTTSRRLARRLKRHLEKGWLRVPNSQDITDYKWLNN